MRLLFIHEVNWRRKPVYEIHDFPELLSLRGHDVVFIDFPEGERPSGLRRFLDLRTEVSPDESRAHRGSTVQIRTPGRVVLPPLDRLAASVTQVPEIWRTLRDGQFDAVVLYGVPTNGWQAVRIAHHFDVPVLFRAIDLSHALRATPFGWLIRRAERSILRRADWVSTHNEALAEYCARNGADPQAITVDYPGIDLDRFDPGPRDPALAQRYGIRPTDRVVLFMGTFFRFAGLDWFLDHFAATARVQPDVRLVLVGDGEAERALKSQVERLGIESSVVFTGFVGYEALADHLRLADVAINPFPPSAVADHALPGKVLQYVACGLPTVSTPLRGLQGLFEEGSGIRYELPGEPFVGAVASLLAKTDARRELAESGRRLVEERCRWGTAVRAFEQAIRKAIRRHAAG